jgi:hypothetical protein
VGLPDESKTTVFKIERLNNKASNPNNICIFALKKFA